MHNPWNTARKGGDKVSLKQFKLQFLSGRKEVKKGD